jgi:hypothetical protein
MSMYFYYQFRSLANKPTGTCITEIVCVSLSGYELDCEENVKFCGEGFKVLVASSKHHEEISQQMLLFFGHVQKSPVLYGGFLVLIEKEDNFKLFVTFMKSNGISQLPNTFKYDYDTTVRPHEYKSFNRNIESYYCDDGLRIQQMWSHPISIHSAPYILEWFKNCLPKKEIRERPLTTIPSHLCFVVHCNGMYITISLFTINRKDRRIEIEFKVIVSPGFNFKQYFVSKNIQYVEH